MAKRELQSMSNEELIVQFAFSVNAFSRSYHIYKCDLKQYENVTEELIKRNLLTKENADRIKAKITL